MISSPFCTHYDILCFINNANSRLSVHLYFCTWRPVENDLTQEAYGSADILPSMRAFSMTLEEKMGKPDSAYSKKEKYCNNGREILPDESFSLIQDK